MTNAFDRLGPLLDQLESFDSIYSACIERQAANAGPDLRRRLERLGHELHELHLEVEGLCLALPAA